MNDPFALLSRWRFFLSLRERSGSLDAEREEWSSELDLERLLDELEDGDLRLRRARRAARLRPCLERPWRPGERDRRDERERWPTSAGGSDGTRAALAGTAGAGSALAASRGADGQRLSDGWRLTLRLAVVLGATLGARLVWAADVTSGGAAWAATCA